MQSREKEKDGSKLYRRAERLTIELLGLASQYFAVELPRPKIRFDLRGQSAGQACTREGGNWLIRYNAGLLERHPREFLAQTVAHETAHLVTFSLFGPGIAPHGREWRTIMALFGAPPQRCHRYNVEGLQTRQLRRYDYRCACSSHRLTSIRHNRIRSGQTYLCRRCGGPLERVAEPASHKPK
jgi:SprT protein